MKAITRPSPARLPSSAPLLLALLFIALLMGGCASNECYTETGYNPSYAIDGIEPVDGGGDAQAELDEHDPFEDDPFADDPFEDDFVEGDPFAEDPLEERDLAAQRRLGEAPNCPLPPPEQPGDIFDPIEPINRVTFWVNDKLYGYVLKPVARGYRFAVPEPVRMGVGNFFSNLATPLRAMNSFLQLKVEEGFRELSRFTLNTTIGVLGFIDVASKSGMKTVKEDFGQTLGHYGVGNGFYLVLPLFGPSSARDTVGLVADHLMDPINWAVEIDTETRIALTASKTINAISLDKDTYEALVEQSLDPYATMRSGYVQMRKARVKK